MEWIKTKSMGGFIVPGYEHSAPEFNKRVLVVVEGPVPGTDKTYKVTMAAKYCCCMGWIYDSTDPHYAATRVIYWMEFPKQPLE